MNKSYIWTYQIDVAPYDKLLQVLEAFFCSYPGGDYTCEDRQNYKLIFRRGLWKKSLLGLGELVPDRLIPGKFHAWPVIVRTLVRPSPNTFSVTISYEVHLPKSIPALTDEVQTSIDQHAQNELTHLCSYLAECIGLDQAPTIQAMQ